MIKKYGLYALVALLGAVFTDTHAVESSATREDVTNFVADQMRQMFTPIQRAFTDNYIVARVEDNVFVERVPLRMSTNPARARALFNTAIIQVAQQILNIYDENGPAEYIDVVTLSNYQNTVCFAPYFSDEEVENSVDESDSENDMEDNNNISDDQLFSSSSSNNGSSDINSSVGNTPPELWR